MRPNPKYSARNPKVLRLVVVLCVFGLCYVARDAAGVELSRGRSLLLEWGLQIHGYGNHQWPSTVAPEVEGSRLNIAQFQSANFTAIDGFVGSAPYGGYTPLLAALNGAPWGWVTPGYYQYASLYADSCVSACYEDEPGPWGNPGEDYLWNRYTEVRDAFVSLRSQYPKALVYVDTSGLREYGGTEASLRAYMQNTRPDMLFYQNYVDYGFSTSNRNTFYSLLSTFRKVGQEGYNGSGQQPIAVGTFTKAYRSSYTAATPSESYVRLMQFAPWAFGHLFVMPYVYDRQSFEGDCAVLFNNQNGDTSPNTTVFNYVAGGGSAYGQGANLESRNLGPALVRLVSTDIQMIRGSAYFSRPSGISRWGNSDSNGSSSKWQNSHTADTDGYTDYITSITPTQGQGGATSTSYSDILVGYLDPLLSNNADCTFADGLHFMIVNGAASGTASESAQWYHITFDFLGSAFNSLVRLSRDTGRVELVTLASTGGSTYALDLNLPGGTGDLFAFWNSSTPLPTIPEPGSLVLLFTGLIGVLAYVWRRKRP